MALEQGEQERAVAAADVYDRLVASPFDALDTLQSPLPALRHRAVERRPFFGVLPQPGPELVAVHAREGGLSAQVERRCGLQPRSAEELRERVPAVVEQHLG